MKTTVLKTTDLSPVDPTKADDLWLTDLQRALAQTDHVIRLGSAAADDEPVISRDASGRWWTGRYIGEIRFKQRTLEIRPRLGIEVIEQWLSSATNMIAVPDTASRSTSRSFVALLLAAVWCRAVDRAARHGPPAFRADRVHDGLFVRGALDVRATAARRARGSSHLVSVARFRELDNDVARAMVAAERVLTQRIGHNRWRTERVRDVMAHLVPAVGARPALPTVRQLQRIRYTPITRPYRDLASLSHRIASQQGMSIDASEGSTEGLLLDVAELWELFLLHALRDAFDTNEVEHGTTSAGDTFLLTSDSRPRGLGRVKPDFVVRDADGGVVAVLDAKYKRLANRWPDRPDGVDRADLYQLSSYLSLFDPHGEACGALLYPQGLADDGQADAHTHNPWRTASGSDVFFVTVPVEPGPAVNAMRDLLATAVTRPPSYQIVDRQLEHLPDP